MTQHPWILHQADHEALLKNNLFQGNMLDLHSPEIFGQGEKKKRKVVKDQKKTVKRTCLVFYKGFLWGEIHHC